MSDASGGYTPGSPGDRLNMMRAPGAAAPTSSRRTARNMRVEFVVGIMLIVGGIAVALYLRGGPNTSPVASVPASADGSTPTVDANDSALLAGEVAVSFAVEDGNYPPSLRVGDVVRLVVTPNMDGDGEVRSLAERIVVMAIDEPADAGTKRVVTVRAPEAIAPVVAASGPVHVSILGGAPS